jgi:hypothetical protein
MEVDKPTESYRDGRPGACPSYEVGSRLRNQEHLRIRMVAENAEVAERKVVSGPSEISVRIAGMFDEQSDC